MEEAKEMENEPPIEDLIKEEIELNLKIWLPLFYVIYYCSYLVPGILFISYIILFYLPYFLEVRNFISLFNNLYSLTASLTLPLVIILCYLIHLFVVALTTRFFWRYAEKRSPSKSGIIPRNIPSKTLNYYHFKSFIIKFPKNCFSRGPFPWLLNAMFNFVGTNKVGKGSVIEEQIAGDRFVDIGENCHLGINVAISSHAVDGIFGNISFAKIKIGDNVTTAAFNCVAPGVNTGNNSWWLPMTGATKYNIMKGEGFYFGTPLRKIFKKKVMEYLQISEEDLIRAEKLSEKKKSSNGHKLRKRSKDNV
ncbi:MAG: hypothetical protein ACFFCM_18925 [Promethearchaeota archaeon]